MKKNQYFIWSCLLLSFLVFSACGIKNRAGTPYTDKEFPLSIVLDQTEYQIGDTISFTVSITNQCGRNVTLYSNGNMPCVDFQNTENQLPHTETSALASQKFKKNETLSRDFSFVLEEAGTYLLDAHYTIAIDDADAEDWFTAKLDAVEITVTP